MEEEPPPIIFWMNVHCQWCADTIHHSLMKSFGARKVDASASTDMVVVHGGKHLDPWTIKRYLQRLGESRLCRHGGGAYMSKEGITIASDGGRPQRAHPLPPPPHYRRNHSYPPPPPPHYGRNRSYPPPPPAHYGRNHSYPPPSPPHYGRNHSYPPPPLPHYGRNHSYPPPPHRGWF